MPEEAKEIKRKIIDLIKIKGPSLPIQMAHATNITSIFAGAFLSELFAEKIIKISHMKVGGSPLYFMQGQEAQLENFYHSLPSKEKEAFLLLKEKKILKDNKQLPAIRVALRNIKDFALPFLKDNEIFWRFYSVSEQEIKEKLEPIEKVKEKIKEEKKTALIEAIKKPVKIEIVEEKKELKIKPREIEAVIQEPKKLTTGLDIFDKTEKPRTKVRKKQTPEKFFEEVKSSLKEKNIELVSIENYNKKELIAKIRFNLAPEKMHLLIAYNKKKIDDKDLLKAYKKSLQYKLDYIVFFKGEMPKKLKESINAYKSLVATEKIML